MQKKVFLSFSFLVINMCLNVQHSKFLIMTDLSQATTQLALALNCLVMLQSKNAQEKTKLCGPWTIHCHYDFTNIGYLRQYLQDVTHLSPNQFFTLQNLTNEHSEIFITSLCLECFCSYNYSKECHAAMRSIPSQIIYLHDPCTSI
jgi:hypothetical protein